MKINKYIDSKTNKTMYQLKGYVGTDQFTGKKIYKTLNGFAKKKDAETAERSLKNELESNGSLFTPKRMRFREVAALWLPIYEVSVKESTFQIQSDVIKNHILSEIGEQYVDKITTAYCQSLVNKWTNQFSRANNVINLTQRILEYARKNLKIIKSNPMLDTEKPKKARLLKSERYEAPYYNSKQLNHFLECANKLNDNKAHTILRVISYTGIREGEACGLMWQDFDEVNNTLTIERAVIRGKNYKKKIGTTKSLASDRTISIDDKTAQILRNWKKEQRETMLMLGFNTNSATQFMFTNDRNEYYHPLYPYDRIKAVRKKFVIDDITVHGLRHTHCTLLFESGKSLKEVQERLGHENTNMVLEVYNHVNIENKKEIGNDFANFISQDGK